MKQKKAIILYHGGGELANQLWNYISIYAYTKEHSLDITNHSFYEYANYFQLLAPRKNNQRIYEKLIYFFLYKPFENNTKRKFSLKRKFYRKLYGLYVKFIKLTKKTSILSSINTSNQPYYLPPTSRPTKELELLESKGKIYFDGWLFRNPLGIKKYKKDILDFFSPRKIITDKIEAFLKEIRSSYTHVVGLHIRQGDYKTWQNGLYFIEQTRFRSIIDEYLSTFNKDPKTTCIIITSDGPITKELFEGLHIRISKNNMVEDLFTLAATDLIIGTNSSFGNFAAFWGDIPHIIATNEKIEWEYYKDKTKYFYNKYCTLVHF